MATLAITSTSTVALTWDAAPNGPTPADGDQVNGYEVRALSDTGAVLNTWAIPATATTHTLSGAVLPRVPFSVVVVAVSKAGMPSAPSNALSFRPATAPTAPANLRGVVAWS